MEKSNQPLKDLFGDELLGRISKSLARAHPSFDPAAVRDLLPELEGLEMKARVRRIREELHRQLPADYPRALRILLASVRDGLLEGFDLWPYSDFVQTYGLEDAALSLEALRTLTPHFSSEFAVRPFLRAHPARTLAYLKRCARDRDVDVRRWASEGSRPRLPWGERLHDFVRDPRPTLALLEPLKFDEELYVRKSVSNHLNDIAKDHPDALKRWQKAAGARHALKIEWIIRRSLRTLIKAGHSESLKLIGVAGPARVEVSGLRLSAKRLRVGERLEFDFSIRSLATRPQKLVIDYVIHYRRANGGASPKVFKLKTMELPPRSRLRIVKNHWLKDVSIRKHHAGAHALEIQINGKRLLKAGWHLEG